MAIRLGLINFIIPIKNIEKCYNGTFKEFFDLYSFLVGKKIYHDDHLFCEALLSTKEIKSIVHCWEERI